MKLLKNLYLFYLYASSSVTTYTAISSMGLARIIEICGPNPIRQWRIQAGPENAGSCPGTGFLLWARAFAGMGAYVVKCYGSGSGLWAYSKIQARAGSGFMIM
jgi:hypothetical protein